MSAFLLLVLAQVSEVKLTRHNLSASSDNPIRATTVDQVCVFCHVPHGASDSRATWSRDLRYQAAAGYQSYESRTLDAVPGRPNGATRLCLSCHDGALALGALVNLEATRPAMAEFRGGLTTMPRGPARLGFDLRNDHPVSIVPSTSDPEVKAPEPGGPVKLAHGTSALKDSVQCTSCHDPHLATQKFLVKSVDRGGLCMSCHQKVGWFGSSHELSNAPYPATGTRTVGEASCLACHAPHNGQSPTMLLSTRNRSGAPLPWAEENVCLSCHRKGGTGVDPSRGRAAADLESEGLKASKHPLALKTDEHQPVFTARQPEPEPVLNAQRHVECTDCHNPHRSLPLPGNVHEGMKGVSLSGATVVDDLAIDLQQHEVCLRCHGDTFAAAIPPAPRRPPSGSNKRLEFQPSNDAFHPVGNPGRNTSTFLNNVLDAPEGQLVGKDWQGNRMSRFSTVLCTDCHNSEATADALGSARNSTSGPKGPHGSANPRMLRANYSTAVGEQAAPFAGFDPNNFALCFLCHDSERLRGDRSNFTQPPGVGAGKGNLHQLHLAGMTNSSCHECHSNVHSNVAATNTDYRDLTTGSPSRLVDFAWSVAPGVGADPWFGDQPARPRWGRLPSGDLYCFASCHGSARGMDGVRSVYRPPAP